jgi:hypothetical protein
VNSFGQTVTGTRYATNTMDKGKVVPGTSSQISFRASVQPIPADEMKTLPEGLREKEAYRLYTETELFTVREAGKKNADRVSLFGKTFQIISVANWRNGVISHYKAVASLIDG